MYVFMKKEDDFNNFNNPLAIKIDTNKLFNSIIWVKQEEQFKDYEETLKLVTQLDLIMSLFKSLRGSLVVFNGSFIETLEKQCDIDLQSHYKFPLDIYEVNETKTTQVVKVIDLAKLNSLIKEHF